MPRTRVCSRLTQPSRLRLVHTSLFPFLSRALPRHSLLHFFPLSFPCSFHAPFNDNLPFTLSVLFFLFFRFLSICRIPALSPHLALCVRTLRARCPFVFARTRPSRGRERELYWEALLPPAVNPPNENTLLRNDQLRVISIFNCLFSTWRAKNEQKVDGGWILRRRCKNRGLRFGLF